jgi:hypothetical protein
MSVNSVRPLFEGELKSALGVPKAWSEALAAGSALSLAAPPLIVLRRAHTGAIRRLAASTTTYGAARASQRGAPGPLECVRSAVTPWPDRLTSGARCGSWPVPLRAEEDRAIFRTSFSPVTTP